MQRRHVDLIDVRPLLAIDFDVDEEFVHHGRGGVILKTFVRHDVAPMTGRIADREQDRPAGALGFRKRLRAPGPPVNRIVLVLKEIRARLLGETIFVRSGSMR
jgi:hypothetical protein